MLEQHYRNTKVLQQSGIIDSPSGSATPTKGLKPSSLHLLVQQVQDNEEEPAA